MQENEITVDQETVIPDVKADDSTDNQQGNTQGKSEPAPRQEKDPWKPDSNGNVDIRDIFQEIMDDEPAPAADEIPERKTKIELDKSEPIREREDSKGSTGISGDDLVSGEVAFETVDFLAVMMLCWWAKNEDEDIFAIPEKRRKRLIKAWDAWLKSVNYKISPGLALALVNLAAYGPMAMKAFKERKKQTALEEKAAEIRSEPFSVHHNGPTVQHHTSQAPPLQKVDIPPLKKIKIPTAGVQGRKSKHVQELEGLIKQLDDDRQQMYDILKKLAAS